MGAIIMLAFSFYVLAAQAAMEWLVLPDEVHRLLSWIDTAICCVFLVDFFIQLARAPCKGQYLKWGWIDLVSSLPFFPFVRWGRLVRIARVLMVLRSFRSLKRVADVMFRNRAQGTILTVLVLVVLLLFSGTVAILLFETGPHANIRTAGDAVWWAFSTLTGVGYGDYYPITWAGRLVAAVLMTAGVGLFGTLTAWLASWFMGDFRPRDDRDRLRERRPFHER